MEEVMSKHNPCPSTAPEHMCAWTTAIRIWPAIFSWLAQTSTHDKEPWQRTHWDVYAPNADGKHRWWMDLGRESFQWGAQGFHTKNYPEGGAEFQLTDRYFGGGCFSHHLALMFNCPVSNHARICVGNEKIRHASKYTVCHANIARATFLQANITRHHSGICLFPLPYLQLPSMVSRCLWCTYCNLSWRFKHPACLWWSHGWGWGCPDGARFLAKQIEDVKTLWRLVAGSVICLFVAMNPILQTNNHECDKLQFNATRTWCIRFAIQRVQYAGHEPLQKTK